MKRHGNLWNKIIDKDNLLLAFKKAKRHKSWQQKVIKVEQNLEEMIEKLRESLINGTYKTSAQIQIELHGELRVIFTNSTVLKEQLQRYKEHLPFCTTIIKNNKYFSFS